jgi:hypothetical protein
VNPDHPRSLVRLIFEAVAVWLQGPESSSHAEIFFINIPSFNETRFGFRDLAKGTIDVAVVTVSAKFDFGSAALAEEKPIGE